MSDGDLFLLGGVASFTALAGAYVYLRAEYRRCARSMKVHAGARLAARQASSAQHAHLRSR